MVRETGEKGIFALNDELQQPKYLRKLSIQDSNVRRLSFYSKSTKHEKPIPRTYSLKSTFMAFNEEVRLFRGKFSPPTVCASFPMFCIENSGEGIKAISRSLV